MKKLWAILVQKWKAETPKLAKRLQLFCGAIAAACLAISQVVYIDDAIKTQLEWVWPIATGISAFLLQFTTTKD